MPAWFLLALACACAWAAADALCKRALRERSPWGVLAARWWYALPFLALALVPARVPAVDGTFWAVIGVSAPLEVYAMHLYLRALEITPLSRAAPLLAWTPVFTALLSAAGLREFPSAVGAAGILAVAAGSWLLYAERGDGLGAPLAALARDRGARFMLAVALVFSLTSALGKVGVRHSSAEFFGPAYVAALAVCLVPAGLLARGRAFLREAAPSRLFLLVGTATGIMTVLHFEAIARTNVAYMISVKRSSLLVSVLLGRVFFGETGLGRRLPGAALMFAGVLLLGLLS